MIFGMLPRIIIIIIMLNFYSPVSNTMCHSMGPFLKIIHESKPSRPSRKWGQIYGGKAKVKR